MNEQTTSPATVEEHPPSPTRRWDPFSWFSDMDNEVERFFGDRRFPMMRALRRGMPEMPVPKVDIVDRDGAIVVKAELPGVKREDVSVELAGHDLIIEGKREEETETKEDNYYRMERSSGSFYRRIPLPEGVSDENITASYEDGVLEVMVPRPPASTPGTRKIELK